MSETNEKNLGLGRSPSRVVVGIDVGGDRKGFHAVALGGGHYLAQLKSRDPVEVADFCTHLGASTVGVDAPCCLSTTGSLRRAEHQLIKEGISCFSSPTLERALVHPTNYYGWMLNGLELYKNLAPHFRPFDGKPWNQPIYFETFPHAITCSLNGHPCSAKEKNPMRRSLLQSRGLDPRFFKNIDAVDAAVCALAAHFFIEGTYKIYGDDLEGYIVVPTGPLPPAP